MTAFSPANVARAKAQIPSKDSRILREWARRAREHGISDLVDACEQELKLRGPLELDAAKADLHAQWTDQTQSMTLEDAIVFAFTQKRADEAERMVIRQLVENDNPSYADLVRMRGKGDVGLVLGHFVYERFGCFKRWIADADKISDILFAREAGGSSIRYRLTPDARAAFDRLGLT